MDRHNSSYYNIIDVFGGDTFNEDAQVAQI